MNNVNQQNIENFWIRVYLGSSQDFVNSAIKRAYLDFSRTKHKYSEKNSPETYETLKSCMRSIVSEVLTLNFDTQDEFDIWHKQSCDHLINTYFQRADFTLHYGQAQKWINMTLKYLYALGETRVSGISNNYQWFHIPVDNIIQEKLSKSNIILFKTPWSRIKDYDKYLDYQKEVRNFCGSSIPMDLEFALFNELEPSDLDSLIS